MNKQVLIIGAGKIGRGFVAQLFYRSGYKLWFLDASREVVDRLNGEKKYRIDIAGEKRDTTEYISLEGAFTPGESEKIADTIDAVDIIVSSVGAANMESIAHCVKKALISRGRTRPLNWIICENANDPAKKIRDVLLREAGPDWEAYVRSGIGLIETQVLRTGMTASEDVLAREPLALRMQDWWTLPLDGDAFIGPVPEVEGFRPRSHFSHELLRKLYTFNGTNGPIAYVGWANGYRILHESALAYPLFFRQIQEEAAHGLIREFGYDKAEQEAFATLAMKKYTDPALHDQVERNAHDSRRKLGRDERLVGPALLCLKWGREPLAYAKAIAAAYYYNGSTDAGTQEVLATVRKEGIENAVKKISSLDESSALYHLVLEAYRAKGFIF
ncbi:MAG: hypothetical protein INR73_01005 [Williamsia sp.]|nr:hypothetical protein [Williamsia sp.]